MIQTYIEDVAELTFLSEPTMYWFRCWEQDKD